MNEVQGEVYDDYEDIYATDDWDEAECSVQWWNYDGRTGNITDRDGKERCNEGIILGYVPGQILFGGDKTPFPEADTWICRSRKPGQPCRVNDGLDPQTYLRLRDLGHPGDGGSCAQCPLRLWDNDTNTKPLCGQQLGVVFVPSDGSGIAVINCKSRRGVPAFRKQIEAIRSTSLKAPDRFPKGYTPKPGAMPRTAIYSTVVRIDAASKVDGKSRWVEPVLVPVRMVDRDAFGTMRNLAETTMPVLRAVSQRPALPPASNPQPPGEVVDDSDIPF